MTSKRGYHRLRDSMTVKTPHFDGRDYGSFRNKFRNYPALMNAKLPRLLKWAEEQTAPITFEQSEKEWGAALTPSSRTAVITVTPPSEDLESAASATGGTTPALEGITTKLSVGFTSYFRMCALTHQTH